MLRADRGIADHNWRVTRSALVEALSDAVLALTGADGAEGTGFFVAPGLVLTCAHVVGSADGPVTARWRGRDLTLTVAAEWFRPSVSDGSGPDLALLRVPEGLDHPEVCLADFLEPGDDLWAYGHPRGRYRAGDSVAFTAQGPSRRTHDGGGSLVLHHATQGRAVPGFSGAPVLNWRTGAVCGVLRFAHSLERGVPGARLTPVAELLASYPFLSPPEQITRRCRDWLSLLDDGQLRAGGWHFAGPALRAYLGAAREAAYDHPYAIRVPGAGTPPLADVYVSQQVAPDGEVEPHAELGDTPRRPAESLFDVRTGAVLVGGPGAGKSSLGLRLTAKLADAWLTGEEPDVVPVRVPARALVDGGYVSDLLRTAVEQDSSVRLRAPLPDDFFTGPPMPGVPWLVLVDGVDEVLDLEERQYVLRGVASLWRSPDFRFLVTTRPLPRDEFQPLRDLGAPFFRIEPFDREVLPGFAGQWFRCLLCPEPDALAERFIRTVEQSQLLHLAGIPLLATMLVVLFAENPHSALPGDRIDLYKKFTDRLLEKMHRRPTVAVHALRTRVEGYPDAPEAVNELVKGVRGLVEAVALHRQSGELEATAVDLAARETMALRPSHLPEDEWHGVLRELLQRTGLMLGEGDDLVFLHQTVQEFLAACITARTTDPAGESGHQFMSGRVDEGWEIVHFPEENAYVEFVFGLWAKQGKDAGDLVLKLFEVPEWRRQDEDGASDDQRAPGQGTGLSARLLSASAVPRRVLPEVVTRLTAAALNHGCAWAAGAIAHEDADVGIALLAEMVTAPGLAPYQRLSAAWELAAWDWDRAITLLEQATARGMEFAEDFTYLREVRSSATHTTTHTFYVPVDESLVITTRLEAAWTLGMLDQESGVRILTRLASDESLLVGDRIRAALILAQLDPGVQTLPTPSLVAGMDIYQAQHPEVMLEAAKADAPEDPAALLTKWARDTSRLGEERVTAAQALVLCDVDQGIAVLEELVRNDGLYWDADTAWAAENLIALDRDRAVRALTHRVTEHHFALGADIVNILVDLDREAAANAFKARIASYTSHSQVDDAYILAQLDQEAGEAALVQMVEEDFGLQRWEAALRLAAFNPQRALALVKSAIEQLSESEAEWQLSSARQTLREIEAAAAPDE